MNHDDIFERSRRGREGDRGGEERGRGEGEERRERDTPLLDFG